MSVTIPVTTANGSYPIHVARNLLHSAGTVIGKTLSAKKIAIVTDANVGDLYGATLEKSLTGYEVTVITVPAGESSKSFENAEKVCDELIKNNFDRSSAVIALGGGVVGDLAGFVAAVYFRGIPVVQIPTSVVAQVDSAIGGKTGINSRLGKNLIGAFHQPSAVLVDSTLLKTLPPREKNEGFAEIIKHAIIRDAEMLSSLQCETDKEWEDFVILIILN